MSGLELAGAALGLISTTISVFEDLLRSRQPTTFSDAYANPWKTYRRRATEHGFVTVFLLYTIFPDALFVMDRVERYVLHVEDAMVLAWMKSYSSSFNMIGVAVSLTCGRKKA